MRRSHALAAWLGLSALALVGAAGCAVGVGPAEPRMAASAQQVPGQGPPAQAPAHGQRRKHSHDPVEMVYDARLDLYAVVGHDEVYWDGARYVRWSNGAWQASVRIDGVWVSVARREVPARLVFWHERGYAAQPASTAPVPASPSP